MFTKIVFNRRNRYTKNGLANIEIEFYIVRSFRYYRSTGISVLPSDWDENNKRILPSHPEAKFLNKKLIEAKYKADLEIFNYNPEDYKEKKAPKQLRKMFYEFFATQMEKDQGDLSDKTLLVYQRTLRYLKEYEPADFPIDKINLEYIENFDYFLKTKIGLAKNSRASLLKKLKRVVGICVSNKYLSYADNPFLHFKVREAPVEKKSLSLAELKRIENLDMQLRPELEKAKDMFLFSCYTGLRFGDLSKLNPDNFELLDGNRIRLSYTANKTKKTNAKRIEWVTTDFWNGKIDVIIHKYLLLGQQYKTKQFFKISNAKYNQQLKELGQFAKIKQPLTSHLARHTCITLLINDYGMDITKVQMMAGHSKIEMTRHYLRTTERDLEREAKRIKWD